MAEFELRDGVTSMYDDDDELEPIPTGDELESAETDGGTDGTDMSVADKLYQVSEATNGDGTVDVEVADWGEKMNDRGNPMGKLYIRFITPTGETKSEKMAFPERDDPEYKFVRVVEQMGLSLRAAMMEAAKDEDTDMLEGETVKADPDDWTLVAPEPEPWYERVVAATWDSRRGRMFRRVAWAVMPYASTGTFVVSALLVLVLGGATLGLVATLSLPWTVLTCLYGVLKEGEE